ncbi:hypothetical protein ETB97_012154 [Aspergillus alliaceus]|uniref:Uncharacterized protein n=1 Tax=Petromyces alliaceus TaxID=209559 RepID=A0A8H6A6S5_PETAA|nr:hypothetical protein ETB97_012154 [Aspergillus burnettii]
MLPILSILSVVAQTNAWVYVTRNASNDRNSWHSDDVQPCTPIDQSTKYKFLWDAQGGDWCIYLHEDRNCTNLYKYECSNRDWNEAPSATLGSFSIETGYSSSSLLTATSTPTDQSKLPSSTPQPQLSSSSLSGGQIAGAVIGSVAGAVLIALVAFFLGRCRRKPLYSRPEMTTTNVNSPAKEVVQQPQSPPAEDSNTVFNTPPTAFPAPTHIQSMPAELVADGRTVEMSDSQRVVEIEDNQKRDIDNP